MQGVVEVLLGWLGKEGAAPQVKRTPSLVTTGNHIAHNKHAHAANVIMAIRLCYSGTSDNDGYECYAVLCCVVVLTCFQEQEECKVQCWHAIYSCVHSIPFPHGH